MRLQGIASPREAEIIRRLFEAILMLGSARGFGLIVTLARQKVLSIVLGPAGMGLLGLLRRFLDPLKEILPLGVNAGVVKFVSQTRREGNAEALRRTVSTAAWFFLINSCAAALVILVFSRSLAVRFLGEAVYRHLIVLAAISLPLTIFAAFFNALLVGAQRIGTITRIHYIGHAVTLIVTLPLIVLFELTGAVVGIVLLELFYCAAFGIAAARHVPVTLRAFRGQQLMRLSTYGVATLADGGLWMLVFFLAFADYGDRFGTHTLGLYEIISRLALNYVAVLLFVINSYVFPRMAALQNDGGVTEETNTALRGIWFLMIPLMVGLSLIIRPVIWLFSTSEFYDGAAFLPWQMIGDLFYLTWVIFGWALLGRGRLGAYVAAAVLRNAAFAGSYLLIQFIAARHSLTLFPSMVPETLDAHSGWQSIVWAYSISGLFAAALALGLLKRLYAFRLDLQNWVLIVASCGIMPVLFSADTAAGIGLKFGAIALWLPVVVRREEWKGAMQWLRDLTGRTKR